MTQEFHENPTNPSYINAASSNCLTEVSKWLSSLYKAILLVVNDLLVAKLQEADVASQTSWSFKDSSGVGCQFLELP